VQEQKYVTLEPLGWKRQMGEFNLKQDFPEKMTKTGNCPAMKEI
jgi:hypothetical protein